MSVGKKKTPQKKTPASRQQPEIQKQLMKYTQLKELNNLRDTFIKWCGEDIKMGDLIPTQVLSVYDSKFDGSEITQHMDDIRNIHTAGIKKTGQAKEATLSMMVRLSCKAGIPQEALTYFNLIPKEKPTGSTDRVTPRFRSIIPLLKAYAREGDTENCFKFFDSELLQLKRTGMLTEKEAIQWEDSCGILLECISSSKLSVCDKKNQIERVFAQLFSVVPVLHPNGKQKNVILDIASSCECVPHSSVRVTNDGEVIFHDRTDPASEKMHLKAATLQRIELEDLLSLTERLALEGVPEVYHQQWYNFKKQLMKSKTKYTNIIDAANVGHTAQNVAGGAFSHQQIDGVAAALESPLVVLREHWLRGTTTLEIKKKKKMRLPQLKQKKPKCDDDLDMQLLNQLTEQEDDQSEEENESVDPFEQQLLEQLNEELIVNKSGIEYKKYWESKNMILLSPNNINDDWVIMYVALTMMLRGVSNVQVITNDFFRDHYWRMHQHPSLVTWKDRHLTKFYLQDSKAPHPNEFAATLKNAPRCRTAVFTSPFPFTTSAQRVGSTWLIPISTVPVSWFAVDMSDGKQENSIDKIRLMSGE